MARKNRKNVFADRSRIYQNKVKQLNEKFDVDMYHTKIRSGKAFAAEQKIREFKKILLRSKRFEKIKNQKKLKELNQIN